MHNPLCFNYKSRNKISFFSKILVGLFIAIISLNYLKISSNFSLKNMSLSSFIQNAPLWIFNEFTLLSFFFFLSNFFFYISMITTRMGYSNKCWKAASDPIDEPQFWFQVLLRSNVSLKTWSFLPPLRCQLFLEMLIFYSTENIPPNILMLAPQNLKFLSFPLIIQWSIVLVWRVLGLHLMQLNPNSYLLISTFLSMGWR